MALFEVKKTKIPSNLLADRFLVPPFSVLDTKMGYWQDRKRNWIRLGIKSELGRGDNQMDGEKSDFGKCLPRNIGEAYGRTIQATSIFDPVLCEIAYKWFSVKGARVLDPFAGGSVRGIVAGITGRQYVGIDLSEKQIEANKIQLEELMSKYSGVIAPEWICGDSTNVKTLTSGEFDLVFSCPPYYDLEVYSKKPEDLSNMPTYEAFLDSYGKIIYNACSMLKDDSFAIFVVGNIRNKQGFYYDFVGDTIRAFEKAGVCLYNEAIVYNVAGSLPVIMPQRFNGTRKMGKQHQQFLVFYKGDTKHIGDKFGSFE